MSESVAVITGGASGIGAAIARGLGGDGHLVAVVDINPDGARAIAEEIRAAGGEAHPFTADVSDPAQVATMAAEVVAAHGPPNILVNCAGWDEIGPFIDTKPDFWSRVVDINLQGVIATTHSFYHHLIATRGTIVNISSDAGRVGTAGETVYAAAKAGIIGFSKSVARELARDQVTVNCVCPGPIETPFMAKNSPGRREALARAIPMRRIGEPEDVWHAVRYFASPGAAYVTGQVLSVSGGLTMVG